MSTIALLPICSQYTYIRYKIQKISRNRVKFSRKKNRRHAYILCSGASTLNAIRKPKEINSENHTLGHFFSRIWGFFNPWDEENFITDIRPIRKSYYLLLSAPLDQKKSRESNINYLRLCNLCF